MQDAGKLTSRLRAKLEKRSLCGIALIQKAYEAEEYILNPDYNSDEKYIPRSARREWDCVSRHGQLTVRDDGTCIEGGYCKPKERGEATASDSGLFVMKRLDDKHIFVLI